MSLAWLPLAIQRETIMIVALGSLTVAGVIFALGALAMFVRERRVLRADPMGDPPDPPDDQPSPGGRSI